MDHTQRTPPQPDRAPNGGTAPTDDPAFEDRYDLPPPPPPPRSRGYDLAGLFVLLDAIRSAVPRDLEGRVTSLIRELLLTLRALIDWYLERLDRTPREPQVEDIPID